MIKNIFGFSMLEVLIGCGIMGIAAYGFMTISRQSSQMTVEIDSFFEIMTLKQQMTFALSNESICSLSLSGKSVDSNANIDILLPSADGNPSNSSSLYTVNQKITNKITIIGLYFVFNNEQKEYSLEVEISIGSSGISNKTKKFLIPLSVAFDNKVDSSKVLRCFSNSQKIIEMSAKKNCQSLGGTYNSTNQTCMSCDGNNGCIDLKSAIQAAVDITVGNITQVSEIVRMNNDNAVLAICMREGKTKVPNISQCQWTKTFNWQCWGWSDCQTDGRNCSAECGNMGYDQSLQQSQRTSPLCGWAWQWHYQCCCKNSSILCTCTVNPDSNGVILPSFSCTNPYPSKC
ncbi:MAG: hypothetical protein HQK53_11605 [Oligoflexia bacterium]|nr:hypothetical protein [Oligoflexia bacterium]